MENKIKIYIASPFFDEASNVHVSVLESIYDENGLDYFSPRKDTINFSEMKGKERSEAIHKIFQSNVDNLNECNRASFYLHPVRGRLDIGTLWELGYWIGKYGEVIPPEGYLAFYGPEDVIAKIKTIQKNLIRYNLSPINKLPNQSYLVYSPSESTSEQFVEESVRLNGYNNLSPQALNENLEGYINDDKMVLVTDDLPMQIFILMGYIYSKNKRYYTASFKGFGSNVMIAASSLGHLNLNGLKDDTYNSIVD